MAEVHSYRELARELGVPLGTVHRWARRPGFPARSESGTWDVDEVKAAIAVVEGRAPELPRAAGDDRDVLEAGTDPVELARAAVSLASKRVAGAQGEGVSAALEDLTDALDELRKTEKGFMDLSRARGQLIERDAAKACMGALARRFVLACGRLEVRAAAQVELWLADEKHRALSTDERARAVREWVQSQTRQARIAETEPEAHAEIEKLVAAELAGRKKR